MPQAPVVIRHGHVVMHVNELSSLQVIVSQLLPQATEPDVRLLAEVARDMLARASEAMPGVAFRSIRDVVHHARGLDRGIRRQ